MLNMIDTNDVEKGFKYLKNKFPSNIYKELPTIIYVNQLYSLIKSKTNVDRDLETLKTENKIILFPCNTGLFEQSDVCICEKSEFIDYVKNILKSKENHQGIINIEKERIMFLTDLFIHKILNDVLTLSISSSILKDFYQLDDRDLTCLVQLGLLVLKDCDHFWISIPGIAQFKQDLMHARISFKSIIRKKKVFQINLLFKFIIKQI